jgi:alkaline phosphatase D
MHEPDAIAHADGPKGTQTKKTVIYLDSLVGVFRAKLKDVPIASQVNFVVVSDHGMGEIAPERTLYLDQLVPRYWLGRSNAESVMMNLSAIDAYKDSLYNRLKKVEHLQVWKKEEVPARLHYGKNPNLVDLVVVADSSWNIMVTNDNNQLYSKGAHGYDNKNKDMHGIFYAVGPAFKQGYKQKEFENVNLYPLFAKVLGLSPAKVDGTLEPVQGMLVEPEAVKK